MSDRKILKQWFSTEPEAKKFASKVDGKIYEEDFLGGYTVYYNESFITKFELKKATREIPYKNKKEIVEGCTTNYDGDIWPVVINSFDTKDEALEELKKYKSEAEYFSAAVSYYDITEYYVEEIKYDENGEFVDSEGIWAFAENNFSSLNEE